MARDKAGSVNTGMGNAIAGKAALFVEGAHPGPHKSKRVAQLFGISPEMAKLLRQGRGWTLERVEQARRVFGRSFDEFVFSREGTDARLQALESKVDALVGAVIRGPLANSNHPLAVHVPLRGDERAAGLSGASDHAARPADRSGTPMDSRPDLKAAE